MAQFFKGEYMDAGTKWSAYCRQNFQIHFVAWKSKSICMIQISLKFVSKDPINNRQAWVQIMGQWLKDDRGQISSYGWSLGALVKLTVAWLQQNTIKSEAFFNPQHVP